MDFELHRLINWGGRPSEACFPEGFSLTILSKVGNICPKLGKMRRMLRPVLPYAWPSSKGVVALPAQHLPRGIIQVPPLPPISLQKSIKKPSDLGDHLAFVENG